MYIYIICMKYYPFRGYNSNHNLDPLASHRNSGKRKDSYSYTNIYVKKKKNENSKYLSSTNYRYIFISFLQLINDIQPNIFSIMLICKGRYRKVNLFAELSS